MTAFEPEADVGLLLNKMIIRFLAIFFLTNILSGCSFLVSMVLFNNSDSTITVCNLNHTNIACQSIKPDTFEKVLLVSDKQSYAWRYSIDNGGETKKYSFVLGAYPEHASNVYCKGILQKKCDYAIQYEQNGKLYWAGKDNELPVDIFPEQPMNFPVAPD